jgi:hypothetical protein
MKKRIPLAPSFVSRSSSASVTPSSTTTMQRALGPIAATASSVQRLSFP